jgi:DNA polymerase III epsilon subunit-like protein
MADRFETTASVDLMRPLVNVCKIAKAKGGGFKFPKLTEAHQHLFGEAFDGAHGAVADATAAARIFKHMVDQRILSDSVLSGVQEIR